MNSEQQLSARQIKILDALEGLNHVGQDFAIDYVKGLSEFYPTRKAEVIILNFGVRTKSA